MTSTEVLDLLKSYVGACDAYRTEPNPDFTSKVARDSIAGQLTQIDYDGSMIMRDDPNILDNDDDYVVGVSSSAGERPCVPLSDASCHALFGYALTEAGSSPFLTKISLPNNFLGDRSLESISLYLQDKEASKYVSELNLACNQFTSNGAEFLATALESHYQIQTLNLSGCMQLGDQGISSILTVISRTKHSRLRELDISSTSLTGEIVPKLASFVRKLNETGSPPLSVFCIARNRLGTRALHPFFAAIKRNITIHTLDLSDNLISSLDFVFLEKMLHDNTTLLKIDFSQNLIESKTRESIGALLSRNQLLQKNSNGAPFVLPQFQTVDQDRSKSGPQRLDSFRDYGMRRIQRVDERDIPIQSPTFRSNRISFKSSGTLLYRDSSDRLGLQELDSNSGYRTPSFRSALDELERNSQNDQFESTAIREVSSIPVRSANRFPSRSNYSSPEKRPYPQISQQPRYFHSQNVTQFGDEHYPDDAEELDDSALDTIRVMENEDDFRNGLSPLPTENATFIPNLSKHISNDAGTISGTTPQADRLVYQQPRFDSAPLVPDFIIDWTGRKLPSQSHSAPFSISESKSERIELNDAPLELPPKSSATEKNTRWCIFSLFGCCRSRPVQPSEKNEHPLPPQIPSSINDLSLYTPGMERRDPSSAPSTEIESKSQSNLERTDAVSNDPSIKNSERDGTGSDNSFHNHSLHSLDRIDDTLDLQRNNDLQCVLATHKRQQDTENDIFCSSYADERCSSSKVDDMSENAIRSTVDAESVAIGNSLAKRILEETSPETKLCESHNSDVDSSSRSSATTPAASRVLSERGHNLSDPKGESELKMLVQSSSYGNKPTRTDEIDLRSIDLHPNLCSSTSCSDDLDNDPYSDIEKGSLDEQEEGRSNEASPIANLEENNAFNTVESPRINGASSSRSPQRLNSIAGLVSSSRIPSSMLPQTISLEIRDAVRRNVKRGFCNFRCWRVRLDEATGDRRPEDVDDAGANDDLVALGGGVVGAQYGGHVKERGANFERQLKLEISEIRLRKRKGRFLGIFGSGWSSEWRKSYGFSIDVVELAMDACMFLYLDDETSCALEFETDVLCQEAIHTIRMFNSLHCREAQRITSGYASYQTPPLLSARRNKKNLQDSDDLAFSRFNTTGRDRWRKAIDEDVDIPPPADIAAMSALPILMSMSNIPYSPNNLDPNATSRGDNLRTNDQLEDSKEHDHLSFPTPRQQLISLKDVDIQTLLTEKLHGRLSARIREIIESGHFDTNVWMLFYFRRKLGEDSETIDALPENTLSITQDMLATYPVAQLSFSRHRLKLQIRLTREKQSHSEEIQSKKRDITARFGFSRLFWSCCDGHIVSLFEGEDSDSFCREKHGEDVLQELDSEYSESLCSDLNETVSQSHADGSSCTRDREDIPSHSSTITEIKYNHPLKDVQFAVLYFSSRFDALAFTWALRISNEYQCRALDEIDGYENDLPPVAPTVMMGIQNMDSLSNLPSLHGAKLPTRLDDKQPAFPLYPGVNFAPWTQPGYIPYGLNGPLNPSNSLLGHQSFAFSNMPSYSNLPFSGSVSGMPLVVGSSAALPSVHWGPTSFEEKMTISPSNRSSQRISAKEAHLVTSIASTRAEVQKFKAQLRRLKETARDRESRLKGNVHEQRSLREEVERKLLEAEALLSNFEEELDMERSKIKEAQLEHERQEKELAKMKELEKELQNLKSMTMRTAEAMQSEKELRQRAEALMNKVIQRVQVSKNQET